ncbi:ABC transporter permease [Mycoplasma elephantis]|uniref:ABC transporter permease n=1 Tax=Mycoplasma elephantis TaxID=114882 RepID=UPI000489128C|nr:ABC transporter permease [Mycoplasma elephantis]
MKALFKIQSKMFLRSVATWIVFASVLVIQIIIGVVSTLLFNIGSQNDMAKEEMFKSLFDISQNLFYFFCVFLTFYVCSFIYYTYKKNGLNLIIQTKPINRKSIFYTNFSIAFFYSIISITILWICEILSFSFFIFSSKINIYFMFYLLMLLAGVLISMFFSSMGSFFSTFTNEKLFNFIIIGIPFLIMAPISIINNMATTITKTTFKKDISSSTNFIKKNNNDVNELIQEQNKYKVTSIISNNSVHIFDKYEQNSKNKVIDQYISEYKKIKTSPTQNIILNLNKFLVYFDITNYYYAIANAFYNDINENKNLTFSLNPVQFSQNDINKLLTLKQNFYTINDQEFNEIDKIKNILFDNNKTKTEKDDAKKLLDKKLTEFSKKYNNYNSYQYVLNIHSKNIQSAFAPYYLDENLSGFDSDSIKANINAFWDEVINKIDKNIKDNKLAFDIENLNTYEIMNVFDGNEILNKILMDFVRQNYSNLFYSTLINTTVQNLINKHNNFYNYVNELQMILNDYVNLLNLLNNSDFENIKNNELNLDLLRKEMPDIFTETIILDLKLKWKEIKKIDYKNEPNKFSEKINELRNEILNKIPQYSPEFDLLIHKQNALQNLYNALEMISNSTKVYTLFKYMDHNNKTQNIFINQKSFMKNIVFNSFFDIEEINTLKDNASSHLQVTVYSPLTWYISLSILIIISTILLGFGNYIYCKKQLII